ncbi:MAG TPA: S8/S53 family peptidase [Pseudonocardiaceae bacterium]
MPDLQNDGDPRANAERWIPGEFVVAQRDVPLVRALLRDELNLHLVDREPEATRWPAYGETPVPDGDVELSESLGLALFRLHDPDAVLAALRLHRRVRDTALADPTVTAVTAVLGLIELICRDRYHGWAPQMARNQGGHGVHATPYVSIGADEGYPAMAMETLREELEPADTVHEPRRQPRTVNVGILDTAMLPRPEFEGRWLGIGPDPVLAVTPGKPLPHVSGHATFIAGLVLQLAPRALLHVAQVLDPRDGSASVWDVAKAMMRLSTSVDVLNLSFCCFTDDGQPPLALRHALERMDPTTVVIAAAGNHGKLPCGAPPGRISGASTMWPAAFDRVIAVGSHNREGSRSPFSPDVPWVRVTALGEGLTSTYLHGDVEITYVDGDTGPPSLTFTEPAYARWSGTSFASAVVAALVANLTGHGPWGAYEALHRVLAQAAAPTTLAGLPLVLLPKPDPDHEHVSAGGED